MMRMNQNNSQRKASRKAIANSSEGIFGVLRLFNSLQLALTVLALALSVILLFIGTFVYFDARTTPSDLPGERNPIYDRIMHFYGINETDFHMLYKYTLNSNLDNFQMNKYRIEVSMMFVALISILFEVGLIFSIIFEHFKLSVLYNLIMISGLVYGLSGDNAHIYLASLTFQVFYFVAFCFFSVGIKTKSFAANRMLARGDIELRNDQWCSKQKA